MPTIAQRLVANEQRLTEAWGDILPLYDDTVRSRVDEVAASIDATGHVRPAESGVVGWAHGVNPHTLAELAAAYRATGTEAYAAAARAFYQYWLDEEDGGHMPGDILTIPHRLGDTEVVGWFGSLPHLLSSPSFDEEFLTLIVESARRNLDHLLTILHPARNMRMTQMDALLTEGLRLDWLPESETWRSVGLRGINDSLFRQFNADGSSIEGTGWYHYIVANMALRFWQLGQAMPSLGIQIAAEQVADAFDCTVAMVGPDGKFNRIGDCTASINPYHTLDEVLDRRAEVRRILGADQTLPPTKQVFPDMKQALLRDEWSATSTYLTFDVSRRMGFHWHPARNSLQLQVGKDRLIADPGRMHYEPTPHRCHAVTTRAHSTVNLNGWNQSDSEGQITSAHCDGYDILTGIYDGGFWPMNEMEHGHGMFGSHHRTVIWCHGRFIVVIDNVRHTQGEGEKPTIECNWQFGPGSVSLDPDNRRAESQHAEINMLMLFALCPEDTQFSLHEGEMEPCLGWVADDSDNPVPAPFLQMRIENRDPWNTDTATILIPHAIGSSPEVTACRSVDPLDRGYGSFCLQWGDGQADTFYWTPRQETWLDEVDGMKTDAGLIHLHADAGGKQETAMIHDGSYLSPLVSETKPVRETFATFCD